jgi:hypothetical protein
MTSSDEALKVVFDEVCLPTVLDGGDFVTLAKSHYLVPGKPSSDKTGQTSQTFELASMARASATLWSDGTCMVGLQKGDTVAMRDHIVAALSARGQVMKPGRSDRDPNGDANTAYCNADPRPLLLAVKTPGPKNSKRPAIVANLYRAKGGASDLCLR